MSIEYIKSEITSAFKNVKLGDGIGLWEAQAIDGYESAENRKLARSKDEKVNWLLIPENELSQCDSSLSFFDAQGMLFHIPAFILSELNGNEHVDPLYNLTTLAISNPDVFGLFNSEQKSSIALYLEWYANHPDYEYDKPVIKRALEEFWYKN